MKRAGLLFLSVILHFPLFASDHRGACAGRVINEFGTRTVEIHSRIADQFFTNLFIHFPEKKVSPEITYFMGTLYNVMKARNRVRGLADGENTFEAIFRLPYAEKVEYFTLLKSHPLLNTEIAPKYESSDWIERSPYFIPSAHRDILNDCLSEFKLPNYLADMIQIDPIKADQLKGRLHVSFWSQGTEWHFEVELVTENSYKLTQHGKTISFGSWSLEDGVIRLSGGSNYEFHIEDATIPTLRNKTYYQVARILPDQPLGIARLILE